MKSAVVVEPSRLGARCGDRRRRRLSRSPTSWSTWPRSVPGSSTGRTPGWPGCASEVGAADLVVVASPTYKATYTGLLKLFLDRFSTDGLRGVAVPLMLGAGPAHALAPELALRPLLAEIGGTTVRGHYVLDSSYDDPAAYADWLARVRPVVAAQAGALA